MTVRICLVGAGRAAMVHARSIKEWLPGASAVAVVDPVPEARQKMSDYLGGAPAFESLEQALEAVAFDAVVITTPTFTHRDLAVTAAKAGKHVFCEKPMALTVGECDEMTAAAETPGVNLQVGFMRHFQPEFVAAKERILAGEIGDPMVVKSLTRGPGLPPPWSRVLERSNGMLAEVNSHDFDAVRWLMGSDIARVYAEAVNFKQISHGITEKDFYDVAVVSLRFQSDGVGTIDGACPAEYGYDSRVEILGSKGLIVIGEMQGQPLVVANSREVGLVSPIFKTWPERFKWGYIAEMLHFVESIVNGTTPSVGGLDGRKAVEAVVAANRSWQEERPIRIPQDGA
jgi:scyllo-inositol 2-dehydrogenase (NAD+)